MDATAAPDIEGYLFSFPPLRNEPPDKIAILHRRLRAAQNCCSHCRPIWRQWLQAADNTMASAAVRGLNAAHPSRPVNTGLEYLRALSGRLITHRDQATLAPLGANLASLPIEQVPEIAKVYITRMVNIRSGKSETQARNEERAAMHFYSRQAMTGLLGVAIKYRLRATMMMRNRAYLPEENGMPPYRNTAGKTVAIRIIAVLSANADSGKHYRAEPVRPFISSNLTGADRNRLFHFLHCRRLTGADVPPLASSLIGQWGVFAAKPIVEGSCVGIYAGVLATPLEMGDADLFDHDYIVDISVKGQPLTYLDRDGILSKINTLFDYNPAGKPVSQAETGYNVEDAKFKATLEDGRRVNVIALFATEDISEGQEIRVNYHYSKRMIEQSQHRFFP